MQGKPLEFSNFHRFAAIAASVNTVLLGEGELLFGNLFLLVAIMYALVT